MMKITSKDKILESARLLFMKEGFEGVRMQMVADGANVNKGLLHYYYKTKDKLFTAVFNKVVTALINSIRKVFDNKEIGLNEKIDYAVDAYFELLSKNARIPVFFIFEINRNPDLLKRLGFDSKVKSLVESASNALPSDRDPEFVFHFIITLVSLSVFPFMMKPLINEMMDSPEQSDEFLQKRKGIVKKILINMAEV